MRDCQLPPQELHKILNQIVDALDYTHREGYVHADVKPSNCLMKDRDVLLSDFGSAFLAKELNYDDPQAVTAIYSPPEHLRQELTPDTITTVDVWAFGLVLFDFLKNSSYKTPFVSEEHPRGDISSDAIEATIIFLEESDIAQIPKLLNPEIVQQYDPTGLITDMMMRCLNLDHQQRPTMQEIAECFKSLIS